MMRLLIGACVLLSALPRADAQEILERLDQKLTFSAAGGEVRTRISGTVDLEVYHFDGPTLGLIDTASDGLFNPRLTLFLDAQLGAQLYFFAQARLDRGFDPSDHGAQVRLDEYALRFTPFQEGQLNLQAGKFSTVVGTWVGRHLSWDNPFITAPLPYDNVTPASDIEPAISREQSVRANLDNRYEHNPVIWGPSYTTGTAISGRLAKFDWALELKNAALGARPESWDVTDTGFTRPTYSGRIGFRPDPMWNFGFSASRGAYLRPEAEAFLPRGSGIGDYHEAVLGQDASFAWHHLQIWAETIQARFDVPRIGAVETFVYYLEAKYKFAPQLFGAVRWNQQFFGAVEKLGRETPAFGHDILRLDTSLAYRLTEQTQLKLQYTFQHEKAFSDSHTVAGQLTVRF